MVFTSGEIHPNMDGHKQFASVIAQAIAGKTTLKEVGPPAHTIPKTLSLLKTKKTSQGFGDAAFRQDHRSSSEETRSDCDGGVTTWSTEGPDCLLRSSKPPRKCREMGMDLIIVAVPLTADATNEEKFIRSFSWVMNLSLSFGLQQWDVIAVPPSTVRSETHRERNPA